MNTLTTTYSFSENMGYIERVSRTIIGFVALVVMLNLSINDNVAYSWEILVALGLSLTGLCGWDPLYAILNGLRGKPRIPAITSDAAQSTI